MGLCDGSPGSNTVEVQMFANGSPVVLGDATLTTFTGEMIR